MSAYLITGGTGSFGQAFTRHLLTTDVARVAILSRDEAKQAAMRQAFGDDPRLRFFIGDVRDAVRVMDACRGVDVVVHAAATKRVETCEENPNEAVATNVLGTMHLARACIERGVGRAVFLSTDKAASPNTLYGATKQVAERLWLGANIYAAGAGTRFACTRYGNVLGSTGSVVPLWRGQVARGEPITITDAGMSRFWMRMADAVALVRLALAHMQGGEVFIPKVGRAWITDLAEAIAPGHPVTVVGLRPGEKIHETLITEDESRAARDAGTHYVIEPELVTWGQRTASRLPWVGPGFVYRSDRGEMLTVDQLKGMVG
jgi:UDP-N-acetylglucosamine 4,6-dehydratase